MLDAIGSELIRLRTRRSTWFLLGGALALQTIVALLYASQIDLSEGEVFVDSFHGIKLLLVTFLPTAVAVVSFGHDYRHGTTTLALRGIAKMLAAKALTVAVVAAFTGVGLIGVTLLVDVLLGSTPEMSRVGQVLGAVVLFTTLVGFVGFGAAAVTRNTTVTLVAIVVLSTIIEALAEGTSLSIRFLPFTSALQMFKFHEDGDTWMLPLPLTALALVLLATGGVLLARRGN